MATLTTGYTLRDEPLLLRPGETAADRLKTSGLQIQPGATLAPRPPLDMTIPTYTPPPPPTPFQFIRDIFSRPEPTPPTFTIGTPTPLPPSLARPPLDMTLPTPPTPTPRFEPLTPPSITIPKPVTPAPTFDIMRPTPIPQIGRPLVTPTEFERLTPEERRLVRVVEKKPVKERLLEIEEPLTEEARIREIDFTKVDDFFMPIQTGIYATEDLPEPGKPEITRKEALRRAIIDFSLTDPIPKFTPLPDPLADVRKDFPKKAVETIQKIREWRDKLLLETPETREIQEEFKQLEQNITTTDKRIEEHNKAVQSYEKNVEDFNKKYSGELPSKEYEKAVIAQARLEQQADKINTQSEIFNQIREEEISALEDLGEREKAQRQREKRNPFRVRKGIIVGITEVPLTIAEFGFAPAITTVEMAKGIIELPRALVQDPLLTTGALVGTGAGFYALTSAVSRAGTVAQTARTRTGRPHRTDISVSITDAKQIGKNTYEVKSTTTAKVYDTKTNKLIDTVRSDGVSEVITARTKDGAIRTALDSYAAAIGKRGQTISTEPLKITKKYDLARARGELRFKITDSTKIKGAGIIDVMDIGKVKIKATPGKIVIDPIFKRKAPRDVAVVDPVVAELIGDPIPARRPVRPGVDLLGFEQWVRAQALVEVRPTKIRVKGFTRKDGTRIRAHLRRADKRMRPKELAFDEQLGKVFQYDPETPIGITFEPFPTRLPKPPRVPKRPPKPPTDPVQLFLEQLKRERPRDVEVAKGVQKQILGTELDQAAAQAAARAAQEALTTRLVRKRMVKEKVTPAARQQTAQLTKLTQGVLAVTPAVAARDLDRLWVREEAITKQQQRLLQQARQQDALSTFQTISPLLGVTTAQNIAQRTAQVERTAERTLLEAELVQPLIPITITPITPISPRPPTRPTRVPRPRPIPRRRRIRQIEKEMKEPHHVFILEEGRWKKATKKPLTRQRALDKMAYILDETLSARGRIKKAKGKTTEPKIDVPRDYFKMTGYKFRDYKVRKGVRKPLKDEWIELAPYRLDSPREVQGITKARFMANEKRKRKEVQRVDKAMQNIFGF